MRKVLSVLAVAVLSMTATACAEDAAGFGSASIEWSVQGKRCDTAGIVMVRVDLIQDGTLVISESASCGNEKLLLEEVPEGVYDVMVYGLNKDSLKIYQGEFPGLRVRPGSVPATTPEKIPLVVIKGELKLMWILPTNKPCSGNDILKVEATLWRGVDVLRTVEFYCDPGSVTLTKDEAAILAESMVAFADGWMVFSDLVPGEIAVNLFGVSKEGKRTAYGEETVEVPIGNDVEVEVPLTACQDPCQ